MYIYIFIYSQSDASFGAQLPLGDGREGSSKKNVFIHLYIYVCVLMLIYWFIYLLSLIYFFFKCYRFYLCIYLSIYWYTTKYVLYMYMLYMYKYLFKYQLQVWHTVSSMIYETQLKHYGIL